MESVAVRRRGSLRIEAELFAFGFYHCCGPGRPASFWCSRSTCQSADRRNPPCEEDDRS